MSSAHCFQINLFAKIISGIPTECQNSLDPDQARHIVGPDLGPTACKGYQQTSLGGKEIKSGYHRNPICMLMCSSRCTLLSIHVVH